MKITSWNVNGIRAAVKKNFYEEFKALDPDVFCLQETKAQSDQVSKALDDLNGYHIYSNQAEKKGYSGVAMVFKEEPLEVWNDIGVKVHDNEGRVISADIGDYFLVNVYVPNSGNGLKRLDYRSRWDKSFASYLRQLRKKKPVVVTGDFNVAHAPIDLARPKSNYNKTSGYTQVEIDGMSKILKSGFKDAWRTLNPEKVQYTFWSVRFGARKNNVGWRLDYFLVDRELFDNVKSSEIHDQIMGSDHCPINLCMSK